MIQDKYRELIMANVSPTPDTLRMYMRGEKTLDELKNEYPLGMNKIKDVDWSKLGYDKSSPFRSVDIRQYRKVPQEIRKAFNSLKRKYDIAHGSWEDYNRAMIEDGFDMNTVKAFLEQNSNPYNYEPDKDYYGIKAYSKNEPDSDELLPFYEDVEDEDADIHHLGKSVWHINGVDDGGRGGFSLNGLARDYQSEDDPENYIERILYNIDDPRLKKELLQQKVQGFAEAEREDDRSRVAVITKSKGEDILPRSVVELVNQGYEPERDYEEEHVVKELIPIEEIPIDSKSFSRADIEMAAKDKGMSYNDFIHSKYLLQFLRDKGFALDDFRSLKELEELGEYSAYNNESTARKVMERLMSRGYDNIISDEHLKIKERFL